MAKKRKKKTDPKQLRRWIVALSAVLTAMLALVVFLQSGLLPAPAQPSTRPTVAPNPYGPEDFAYDGDFLTCLAGQSRVGIDVSSHQGRIDWEKVADAGVEFVFVRLGYRGYMNETIHEDVYAKTNLQQAKAAGLQVGAYFFSQAISEEEAREEARFALNVLDGFPLDLPLVYDWEYVSDLARTAQVTKPELMAFTKTFCRTVEAAGQQPMIYFNRHLAQSHLELAELTEYPFWLAMYTDRMTFPHRVDFWQYSDSGRVNGIDADVDLNIMLPA